MVIFYRYVREYQRVYIYIVNGDFIMWDTHAINVPFGDRTNIQAIKIW